MENRKIKEIFNNWGKETNKIISDFFKKETSEEIKQKIKIAELREERIKRRGKQ